MDISNINGISTGDIKSFFNNTSLTKTDKTDSFSDVLCLKHCIRDLILIRQKYAYALYPTGLRQKRMAV